MELRHPCFSKRLLESIRSLLNRTSSGCDGLPKYRTNSHLWYGLLLIGTTHFDVQANEKAIEIKHRSPTPESSLPPVTVFAPGISKGSAEAGYRDDRVTNIGPWQGRSLQDTPYSIITFSPQLIENLQATSADQVFRINPTMQLLRSQYENNQPTANLRGFRVSGPHRDGVPDDQYGHASTMEDTERIEILNGLSGFLYGIGNVGGLVNYVTKQSTDENLKRLTLSSKGHQSWYAHGDLSGKFDSTRKYGYRLNLAKQDGNTPIKGQTTQREFYSLILDAKPRSDIYVHFSASRHNYDDTGTQANWVANATTRPSANRLRNNYSYGPSWTGRTYETDRYTANAKWDVSETLGFRANVLLSNGFRSIAGTPTTNTFTTPSTYAQSFSGLYAPGIVNTLSYQDDKRGAVYADMKFDTGSVNHKVTVGLQYSNTRQERWAKNAPIIRAGSFSIDDPRRSLRPEIQPISRGQKHVWFSNIKRNVLLGDDITFNEKWSALAGLAYTNIASSSYDKSTVTPTLAIIFKPVNRLSTYVSYMESLEQGGVAAEEYQGAVVVNKGQVFNPLTSKQVEIGAKYDWNNILFSGALFQIDKALQYYDLSAPGQPKYVQDGRQLHKGVEFTAVGSLARNLRILGGFTWLDAEIKKQRQNIRLEGKRPPLVADKIFKVRAEYVPNFIHGLTLTAGVNTSSAKWANNINTDRLPGFTIFDIGLRYQVNSSRNPLTLHVELLNAGNKRYWANDATLGDPRTLLASANYRF